MGSAALELAKALGGRAIALVRDKTQSPMLDMSKVEAVATSEPDNIAEVVRAATGGRGVDIALNGVGASVFQPMMASLAEGGRMAVYSVSFGGREVKVDLFSFTASARNSSVSTASPWTRCARPASSPDLSRCLKVASSTRLAWPSVIRLPMLSKPMNAYVQPRAKSRS